MLSAAPSSERAGSFDKVDADFFLASDDETVPSPANPLLDSDRSRVILFVFDWDDTFLPTTILRDCSKTPSTLRMPQTPSGITVDGPEIDDALREEFGELAKVAAKTLEIASSLGEVSLITNGSSDWIRSSCRKYLPSLWGVVDRFRRVSAKDLAQVHSSDPVEWKKRTFCSELNSHFSAVTDVNNTMADSPSAPGDLRDPYKVVISVGDSFHERQALYHFHATTPLERVCIRSIKFVPLPNCAKLKAQHEALACHLPKIAKLTPSCRSADLRYYFMVRGQDAATRLHSLLDESDAAREQQQSVGEATPHAANSDDEMESPPFSPRAENFDELIWALHRHATAEAAAASPTGWAAGRGQSSPMVAGEETPPSDDPDATRSSVMSLFLNKASKILKTGFASTLPVRTEMMESPFGFSLKEQGPSPKLATQLSEGNPMLVAFSDGLEFVD